jgi:hypothetical protein
MLSKYYSLDECSNRDKVFEHLENLKEEDKIIFTELEIDVIRLKDVGLTLKEVKDLIKFLEENDVIEYDDFEPRYGDDYDDDEEEDEDDDYNEDDDF